MHRTGKNGLSESTIAVRGSESRSTGMEVTPPIHLSSTFVHPGVPAPGEYSYARSGNPSNDQLEPVLAQLEDGSDCVVFNAGIAAANAVLAEATTGTAVVMPWDAYYGIRVRTERELPRLGVDVRLVDQTDLQAIDKALDGASLLWAETPTNPHMAIADLDAIGQLARKHGVPWYVDNTFATSLLQRPLDFGAAGSMHSLTKYVGGHSDLLLGAVITADDDTAALLRSRRNDSGTQADGFSIWLARRGLQTMPLRVRHQSETAMELAQRLQRHPAIEDIYYPGLPTHPGHHIAARQMNGGFGGMLSILVEGGAERAQRAIERCELWIPATSLGGVESLIERRARWSGESAPANLVRLSAGLEDVEDLWRDLEQAISGA
ncbi:MAG: PLP-dependent aspartate aminotransferase family protein [Thermomicrobiales bacterium]